MIEEKMAVVVDGANLLKEQYGLRTNPAEGFAVIDAMRTIDDGAKEIAMVTAKVPLLDIDGHPNNASQSDEGNEINEHGNAEKLPTTEQKNIMDMSLEFIDNNENGCTIIMPKTEIPNKAEPECSSIASLEDQKGVPQPDTNDLKMQRRMKRPLYVADLSLKLTDPSRTKSVYQKSQLYLGILFIISIFYSLPVLQMVFR